MCRHTPALHADLPSTMQAARLARALVCRGLCQPHAEHLRQVVVLVTTELVTNAVRHGRAPIALSVDCVFGQGVVLAVSDAGAALPRRRSAGAGAVGGRGVRLVEALCSRWGVSQVDAADGSGEGKRVWAVFDPEQVPPV